MSDPHVEKEKNDFIFKYQKEDINQKLINILGEDFKRYRDNFNKTENYLETGFIPDFPITISLELYNRCNLKCIMCHQEHFEQTKAELPLDILQKIFNECKENKMPSIIIGLGAEPLVSKNIKDVIRMTKEAGIMDVFFGTNGVLLNEEIIEMVVKNQFSRIEISLDAATEETYKKIRGFDRLKKIEENIEKLVEIKKKYNSKLPFIRLCYAVMDINKHEVQQFIKKWDEKVDYIDFQRLSDFSYVNKFGEVDYNAIKDAFCSYPFYSLNIWANGNVTPCCTYYGEKLVMGNIYNETLKEIWDNDKMKMIREQMVSKKFNQICQKCLYFMDRENIENLFKKEN